MFKRNIRPLRDTEEKTEATNSVQWRGDPEVNLGGPLPDALPGARVKVERDADIEVLLKRVFGDDVLIVDLSGEETSAVKPPPAVDLPWRYKEATDICFEVFQEVKRATQKHAPMNSPHEGHSVIREELEELWAHVKADTGRSPEARKEAIQVAAMAVRYVLDLH